MATNDENTFGLEGYNASTYGDAFAAVYDEWYADLDDSDFVTFIASLLPDRPATVLELGVGTGRLLQGLRQHRGFTDRLVGVDSSDKMLDIARRRFAGANDVTLIQGDFSVAIPAGPHDMVMVGYNTLFNLPDEQAMSACFGMVAKQLAPEGSLCIDAVAPVSTHGGDDVSVRTMSTAEVVLSITRHDADLQRITGQFIQFSDGQRVVLRPWVVRYFTPAQLDAIAERAGLTLIERFADGGGANYTSNSPRHISRYRRK